MTITPITSVLTTQDKVNLYKLLIDQWPKTDNTREGKISIYGGLCEFFVHLVNGSGGLEYDKYIILLADLDRYARNNDKVLFCGFFWPAYEIAPRLDYLKSCLVYYQGELLKELNNKIS